MPTNIVVPSLKEDFEALGLQLPRKQVLAEGNASDYEDDDVEAQTAEDFEGEGAEFTEEELQQYLGEEEDRVVEDLMDLFQEEEYTEERLDLALGVLEAFEEADIDPDDLSEEDMGRALKSFCEDNELPLVEFKFLKKMFGAEARKKARERKKGRRGKKAALARASKKFRKSGLGRRFAKKYAKIKKKFGDVLKKGKKRLTGVLGMSADTKVANLIEGIEGLVGEVDDGRSDDAIKSFRFIEEISGLLSEAFAQFHQEDKGQRYDELAAAYAKLGVAAGSLAEGLEEEEFSAEDAEIVEAFQRQMKHLLDGAELYESLTGDPGLAEKCGKGHDDEGEKNEEDEEGN